MMLQWLHIVMGMWQTKQCVLTQTQQHKHSNINYGLYNYQITSNVRFTNPVLTLPNRVAQIFRIYLPSWNTLANDIRHQLTVLPGNDKKFEAIGLILANTQILTECGSCLYFEAVVSAQCWKVHAGFGTTCAAIQITCFPGKPLLILAGQCQGTFCMAADTRQSRAVPHWKSPLTVGVFRLNM